MRKRILCMFLAAVLVFQSADLTALADNRVGAVTEGTENAVMTEETENPDGENGGSSESGSQDGSDAGGGSGESGSQDGSGENGGSGESGSQDGGDENGGSGESGSQNSDDENGGSSESESQDGSDENGDGSIDESQDGEESEEDESGKEDETEASEDTEDTADVFSVQNGDVSLEASNDFGGLLLGDLQVAAAEEQSESQSSYSIADIEMEDNTANITLHAVADCTVVVSIYEETGDKVCDAPYAIRSEAVTAGDSSASVYFDSLPEYYVVKAYLVDTDSLRPLSTEFESKTYTRAMQVFLSLKTTDFIEEAVLNLDDDDSTNFAVVKEDNILIKPDSETDSNLLSGYAEDTNTYTFTNPDKTLTDLVGDTETILVYQDGEDVRIIKTKSITVDEDGTVTVVAAEEQPAVDEVFAYVKLDEIATMAGDEDSDSDDDQAASYDEIDENAVYGDGISDTVGVQGSKTFKIAELGEKELKWNAGQVHANAKASGSVEGSLTVAASVEYYFSEWSTAQKVLTVANPLIGVIYGLAASVWSVDIGFQVSGSIDANVEIEGSFAVDLFENPVSLVGNNDIFKVKIVPQFVVDIKISGGFHTGFEGKFGFRIEKDEGSSPQLTPYKSMNLTLFQLEVVAAGYIGIDFNPVLDITNILHAELDTGVRLEATAGFSTNVSISSEEAEQQGLTEQHECGVACLSISLFFHIPLSGNLEIAKLKDFNDKHNTSTSTDNDLLNVELGSWYYSIKHKQGGRGECPYKQYLVTVRVKNAAGIPMQHAKINNEETYTNEKGAVTIWMNPGNQVIYAYRERYGSGSVSVCIDGSQTVLITLGQYTQLAGNAVKQLSLGSGHSAVVTEDGSLWMWGNNSYGQLGDGTTEDKTRPVQIQLPKKEKISSVSLGDNTSAAITESGSLYMWGRNVQSNIGNGTNVNQTTPVQIPILSDGKAQKVKQVFLDNYNTAAITEDGSLYMWGNNSAAVIKTEEESRSSVISTPVKIQGIENAKEVCFATGNGKVIAVVTEKNELYMWGFDSGGLLELSRDTPEKIMDDVDTVTLRGHGWTFAVIKKDGSLYLWGNNSYGKLGDGTTENQASPKPFMPEEKFRSVSFGENHGAAVTKEGKLYVWGRNEKAQLGIGEADSEIHTPEQILEDVSVKAVLLTDNSSFALTGGGSLYGWGTNYACELGTGSNDRKDSPVEILDCVTELATENSTSGAVTLDGSLWMWGENGAGQVGNGQENGSRIMQKTPTRISIAASADDTDSTDTMSLLSDEETTVLSGSNTKSFTGLRANEVYNFYVMKSRTAQDNLDSDNLLYIGQYTSDESGNLSVTYELNGSYDETLDVFVVGMTQTDLSEAEVSVSDIIYDGEEHYVEAAVTYSGATLTEGTDYKIYGDCAVTEKGEYSITVKGTGLYCGEQAKTYRVKDADSGDEGEDNGDEGEDNGDEGGESGNDNGDVLAEDIPSGGIIPEGLWIAGVSEDGYAYTGRAIKPTVRVYDYKTLLIEKTDYTITYKNNTKANNAENTKTAPTIIVTGKGNYADKETVTFKINGADISGTAFAADDMAVKADSKGKVLKPVPALLWNGKKLKNKTDYLVSYYDSTGKTLLEGVSAAGTYQIKLTGNGNFTGTRTVNLTVTDAQNLISKASVSKIPNQKYTGEAITPGITVKYSGKTLEASKDYTVSYSNNTAVGTAYAVITGVGNYTGTKRVSFKITASAAVNKATVEGLKGLNLTYNGTAWQPKLTLTVKSGKNTIQLKENTDYTTVWTKNVNAGTATVTFTGINGCTGTLKKTFKIKAYNIKTNSSGSFHAEMASSSVPYAKGGAKPKPTVTFVKPDGTSLTLKEGTDYTLSYKNNTALNDGSNGKKVPTVTIKGKGNFAGSTALTYTVTTQDIGNLELKAADKTYQNKKNIYATKLTVTDLDGKVLKAGTDYDSKNVAYAYMNDTTLEDTAKTVKKAGTPVGKDDIIPANTWISVTVTAKRNYTGTLSGKYRITKNSISDAKVTIEKQTYTGEAITLKEDQITVKVKKDTLVLGRDYEIVENSYKNNVKKGTATVTLRGIGNYGGTKTVKFTIKAKGIFWWWRKKES